MKRAACIAALLACVSPLAIGTARGFELSAPDDAQTADIVTAIVVLVCAYGGFQGLRRCFRGAGSAFWTSTLGRWLIGRIAGTLVFCGLFGTGFFLAQRASVPLLDVLLRLGVPFSSELLYGVLLWMWGVPILAAWYLRTITKVCIGKGSRPLRRLIRSLGMGGGGSSAFAGIFEEWCCRWKPGMVLLGASMFDHNWLVGIPDDRGIGVVAGNGSGKGRSSIIPLLLTYPGSVYVQDFKGQNAAVTAQRRRDMGRAVHILDPMGEGGAGLNPLQPLDPEARDYVEQVDAIVDALVVAGDAKNLFWDDSARTLIAGLIDYVVRFNSLSEFEPPRPDRRRKKPILNNGKAPEKTLGAVRDLLINPDGPPLQAMALLGGAARSAAAMIMQASEETVGGIMANALGHTKFLDSRGMREMLSGSDFAALDLNNGNTTVYFVLPPEYLAVHQRALRLVVNTFLAAAAKGRKRKHPTLYILDEFYSLGPLSIMTRAAAIMRGYGVRIVWVVQNVTQLIEMYPRNWETFFANAGQVLIYGINDKAGAEYFSWRLGNRVKWRKRRAQGMRAEWEPAGASSLRDGSEVGRSSSRESGLQIVLNEGGDPFLLRRTPYDKLFRPGEYAPDPFEPRRPSLANRLFRKLRKVMA